MTLKNSLVPDYLVTNEKLRQVILRIADLERSKGPRGQINQERDNLVIDRTVLQNQKTKLYNTIRSYCVPYCLKVEDVIKPGAIDAEIEGLRIATDYLRNKLNDFMRIYLEYKAKTLKAKNDGNLAESARTFAISNTAFNKCKEIVAFFDLQLPVQITSDESLANAVKMVMEFR